MSQEKEIWNDIPGFVGLYEASNLGRIRINALSNRKKGKLQPGDILKPIKRKNGYFCISLTQHDGKRVGHTVNRIVAMSFLGLPKNESYQAAHLDNNRENNKVSNLCWATSKENHSHRVEHGTNAVGTRNGMAKINETLVRAIRQKIRSGFSQVAVAKEFCISNVQVRNIALGINWKHVS